jgi:hypothetical protein
MVSPSPNQYNITNLIRNGGEIKERGFTFSTNTPARCFTTKINRNVPGKSPYVETPGPGHYNVTKDHILNKKNSSQTNSKNSRFELKGSELLDSLESSLREIQYEDLDLPIEWRLRTGHCIDIAPRDTNNYPKSSVPINVDSTSYQIENDGAIGSDGKFSRSERRSTAKCCFHRPTEQKAIARRPLHLGIFERLKVNAKERDNKVKECNRALDRVKIFNEKRKKRRNRKIRSRMTQRSGNIRMMKSRESTGRS